MTEYAVPAYVKNYTLCRLPIPGIDDYGPHRIYPFQDHETAQNEAPQRPANQFIVNPAARDSFMAGIKQTDASPTAMPVGTVIIKEKYDRIEDALARKAPKAYAAMLKHEPGYDAEHGDWEYVYIEMDEPGKVTAASRGKIANCIDCHSNRASSDYLFRDYLLRDQLKIIKIVPADQ